MSQKNRRDFLKRSLAAGTSASILASVPAVHAQQDPKSSSSPLSQLNVCVMGVNGRGGSHIAELLRADDVTISHVCEIDSAVGNSRATAIGERQGKKPTLAADIRSVLDDKSVDAVTVATPNHWHALAGIWAMQAGKDAYVEKPVCHNIAEGAALIATARKYNRMCQVGTQCRSSQAVIDAIDFINQGGIGEVKFARGLCYKRRKSIGALGDYSIPGTCDFNLWSGPALYTEPKLTRPQFHYDWHWQRLYGNGDLGNQGPHQTDIARWGLGINTHPTSIITYGGRLGYQAERNDPDYIDAGDTGNTEVSIYDYGDKCIVFETRGLSVNDSADEELNRLFDSTEGNKIGVVFYGSDGYMVQRSYNNCAVFDKQFNLVKEFSVRGELNTPHFDNFIEACRKRDASLLNADVREGHLSAAISHLGNISYYVGEQNHATQSELLAALKNIKSLDDDEATLKRTVAHLEQNKVDLDLYPISLGALLKFDPETEKFVGNDEANLWLSREYRAPFICPSASEV